MKRWNNSSFFYDLEYKVMLHFEIDEKMPFRNYPYYRKRLWKWINDTYYVIGNSEIFISHMKTSPSLSLINHQSIAK